VRAGLDEVGGLALLASLDGAADIRAQWRRSIATLAALAAGGQPVPLEGLGPHALRAGAEVALREGLVDDLDWLSPQAAGMALLELAAALPPGDEKRALGRRFLDLFRAADPATFIALAARLAQQPGAILAAPAVEARLALGFELPLGAVVAVDALALALVSRPHLAERWLVRPSTGSLPERRRAGRLLERAARRAAHLAARGDDAGVRLLETGAVAAARARLWRDREPLAWRHAAVAHGLLAHLIPEIGKELAGGLDPSRPADWRRSAAALAATVAIEPTAAVERCQALVDGPIPLEDPGVAGAMILGLRAAAVSEREAVEELLPALLRRGGLHACEALLELVREAPTGDVAEDACRLAQEVLAPYLDAADAGQQALAAALRAELDSGTGPSSPAELLEQSIDDFHEAAYPQARAALAGAIDGARGVLELLEAGGGSDPRRAHGALRELDRTLLATSAARDLALALDATAEREALPELVGRLGAWLVAREAEPVTSPDIAHPTYRMHRLRTLLHLVDAGAPGERDSSARDAAGRDRAGRDRALRDRQLGALAVLLDRLAGDPRSALRRALCATLARLLDAMVREETSELSDVLAVLARVESTSDLAVLAEACMDPELKVVLSAYHDAEQTAERGAPPACAAAVAGLARSLPPLRTARVEALRAALVQVEQALRPLVTARSLAELRPGQGTTPLARLSVALQRVAQLVAGASGRLELALVEARPASGAAVAALDAAVDEVLRGGEAGIAAEVHNLTAVLMDELPRGLARAIAACTGALSDLPPSPPDGDDEEVIRFSAGPEPELAPWLPPGRVLGGFYILRPIGRGGGGSVFVACRAERRHDPEAELYALKVPEFTGAQASALSEAEFLDLFRQEAGTLLALPRHRSLARLITFDGGAQPKPFLVMELVSGTSLDHMLAEGELDLETGLDVLDGVGAGLEAMHSVGIAHLDVKPSNIIIRRGAPVLVDFGVSGRHLRPGCATPPYGAPEVWQERLAPPGFAPMPTDAYAYACVAFEVLTGRQLFDAGTAQGVLAAHLGHDGRPRLLVQLADDPALRPLVEILRRGLRASPAQRAAVADLRSGLAALRPRLARRAWPIAPPQGWPS